ncbi:Uncharacterised protein [Vibrio cholerae]|uniref:Uncharacterized protein n=2 Tax=Vibrio cholerae TaxID=666 RepID=A0A656A970_VIBCL|nr:Uncharacterised protein [Vibrio cholerae]
MISTPPGITTLSMKDNFAARSLSPIRPLLSSSIVKAQASTGFTTAEPKIQIPAACESLVFLIICIPASSRGRNTPTNRAQRITGGHTAASIGKPRIAIVITKQPRIMAPPGIGRFAIAAGIM